MHATRGSRAQSRKTPSDLHCNHAWNSVQVENAWADTAASLEALRARQGLSRRWHAHTARNNSPHERGLATCTRWCKAVTDKRKSRRAPSRFGASGRALAK